MDGWMDGWKASQLQLTEATQTHRLGEWDTRGQEDKVGEATRGEGQQGVRIPGRERPGPWRGQGRGWEGAGTEKPPRCGGQGAVSGRLGVPRAELAAVGKPKTLGSPGAHSSAVAAWAPSLRPCPK